MSWAEGYAAETDYTFGYYRQLNPVFARAALTHAGWEAPEVRAACDLGFGQGVSVAVHGCASGAACWGTDFMPEHAAFAAGLAGEAAAAARLSDESFAEFCARDDLPDFDMIGAHGIWTWVSPENRRIMLDFARRKLRPGGVFYVSYNTATGWAALLPLRHLMVQHVQRMSLPGADPMAALDAALGFIQQAFDAKSVYAGQNPLASAMLERMKADRGPYMLHEYFGRHWDLMNFSDVREEMTAAKLTFACSARMVDHVAALSGFSEHRALLDGIEDASFRETVRDVLLGERFRQDYWIKGGRRLPAGLHAERLGAQRVALVEAASQVSVKPSTPVGDIALPRAAFDPYIDALSDHAPRTLDEIREIVGPRAKSFADVIDAVRVLVHVGAVQPAHEEDAAIERARPACAAFNDAVVSRARHGGEVAYLANPVTGGATFVPRYQQLLLLAAAHGRDLPHDAARFALDILGADASKPAPTLEELTTDAIAFAEGRGRVLRAFGIGA